MYISNWSLFSQYFLHIPISYSFVFGSVNDFEILRVCYNHYFLSTPLRCFDFGTIILFQLPYVILFTRTQLLAPHRHHYIQHLTSYEKKFAFLTVAIIIVSIWRSDRESFTFFQYINRENINFFLDLIEICYHDNPHTDFFSVVWTKTL